MKWVEIPLTKGHVALIDADDYNLVASYGKWHVNTSDRSRTYYARKTVRANTTINGRTFTTRRGVSMHVVIFGDLFVDHINGNGLDNRRANLRKATQSENLANRGTGARNRTGFKGVSWSQQHNKWKASVGFHREIIYLGLFATAEAAAAAYDAAALDIHGEFARLNFAESR